MVKAYKAEFVLGLIGSLIGVIAFILSIIFGIVENSLYLESAIVSAMMTAMLLLVAFILGFAGTFRLKRGDKGGGILLVTSGGLSLIAFVTGFYAAWFSFFALPLTLTGGIMALCRKPHPPQNLQ